MSTRNIGILIKKPENIFSNGCIQQVLFLAKILRHAGREVEFLSIEPGYDRFEITNDRIVFTNERTDFSVYEYIILGSLVLLEKNNKAYIDNMVSYGVPIVNLICGNVFVLLQEEFVFNTHHIVHHYIQRYITENWVMEMYDYALDYVKLLSDKPTRIVPYVWDNDIIKTYITNNRLFEAPTQQQRDRSKVNLVFFEPNMSIHKNSFVPLLIANEYYKRHKDRLHRVYVFCGDKAVNNLNSEFMATLDIVKDKKVEVYGRIIMAYILDNIEKNNPYFNVVLSYNILNRLNFLHLELFDMGVPIVHNCSPFEENGMYFDDFALCTAVELIESARLTFDKAMYKNRCKPIIERFASCNTSRIEDYRLLLDTASSRRATVPPPVEPRAVVPSQPTTRSERAFYQGDGYVVLVEDKEDVDRLEKIMLVISRRPGHKKHCEVFTNAPGLEPDINRIAAGMNYRINIRVIARQASEDRFTASVGVDASSFKNVGFIDLKSFISMNDIEVYTK